MVRRKPKRPSKLKRNWDTQIISARKLRDHYACSTGIAWFENAFREGRPSFREVLLALFSDNRIGYANWLILVFAWSVDYTVRKGPYDSEGNDCCDGYYEEFDGLLTGPFSMAMPLSFLLWMFGEDNTGSNRRLG